MPDTKQAAAQAFYLAQLQACKGKCQCNVCKLLRKAADLQTEAMLNPSGAAVAEVKEAVESLTGHLEESYPVGEGED